jgi:hypothetical protein
MHVYVLELPFEFGLQLAEQLCHKSNSVAEFEGTWGVHGKGKANYEDRARVLALGGGRACDTRRIDGVELALELLFRLSASALSVSCEALDSATAEEEELDGAVEGRGRVGIALFGWNVRRFFHLR